MYTYRINPSSYCLYCILPSSYCYIPYAACMEYLATFRHFLRNCKQIIHVEHLGIYSQFQCHTYIYIYIEFFLIYIYIDLFIYKYVYIIHLPITKRPRNHEGYPRVIVRLEKYQIGQFDFKLISFRKQIEMEGHI